jgi:hypothetical protein
MTHRVALKNDVDVIAHNIGRGCDIMTFGGDETGPVQRAEGALVDPIDYTVIQTGENSGRIIQEEIQSGKRKPPQAIIVGAPMGQFVASATNPPPGSVTVSPGTLNAPKEGAAPKEIKGNFKQLTKPRAQKKKVQK